MCCKRVPGRPRLRAGFAAITCVQQGFGFLELFHRGEVFGLGQHGRALAF